MKAHHNDARGNGQSGGSGRGSVKNTSRLEAFAGRVKQGSAEWSACDPAKLQAVVCAITSLGGAVTFGLSRNQGSHSLTLLLDDGRNTMWYNGDASLDDELDEVLGVLEGLA